MDKKDNIQRLIDALRKGYYIKGKGVMKFHTASKGELRHCPLGVACEIFLEENDFSEWEWNINDHTGIYNFVNKENTQLSASYPPEEVLEYFGLNSFNARSITTLNDLQKHRQYTEVIEYLENIKGEVYE